MTRKSRVRVTERALIVLPEGFHFSETTDYLAPFNTTP